MPRLMPPLPRTIENMVFVGHRTADVYSFKDPVRHTWAIFTVCDATCELSVQSDFGNWSYRWHQAGLGDATLTAFLPTCDRDYIARKLLPERAMQEEIDPDATLREIRSQIIQNRRERDLDAERARTLWGEAADFVDELRHSSYDLAFARMGDELLDWCNGFDGPYEFLRHRETFRFKVVRDGLLRVFLDHMRIVARCNGTEIKE